MQNLKGKLLFLKLNKKASSDALIMLGVKGFEILTPLLLIPYLIKNIGLVGYGEVAFMLAVSAYFAPLIAYGYNIVGSRDLVNLANDDKKKSLYISCALTVQLAFILVSLAILTVIITLFSDVFNYKAALYYALLYICFQYITPTWVFLAYSRMLPYASISLIAKLLLFFGMFTMVSSEDDIVKVTAIYALSSSLLCFSCYFFIVKKMRLSFVRPSKVELKKHLKDGYSAFTMQLAPTLYNNSAIFLLGIFSSSAMTGAFSAVQRVTESIIAISRVISNVMIPHLTRDLSGHKLYSAAMIFMSFSLSFLLVIVSKPLVIDLFSIGISEAVFTMQILAVSIVFSTIYLVYGINYLLVKNDDIYISKLTIHTSLVSACVLVPAVYLLGIHGAGLTLLASRMALGIFSFFRFKRISST